MGEYMVMLSCGVGRVWRSAMVLGVLLLLLGACSRSKHTTSDAFYTDNANVVASTGAEDAGSRQSLPCQRDIPKFTIRSAMHSVFGSYDFAHKYSVLEAVDTRMANNWPKDCNTGISKPILFEKFLEDGVQKYLFAVSTRPAHGESGFGTDTIVSAFVFNHSEYGWYIEKSNWYAGTCGAYGDYFGKTKAISVMGRYTGFVITEESWRMGVHTIDRGIYMVSVDGVVPVVKLNILIDPEDLCAESEGVSCRQIFRTKYAFMECEEPLPRLVVAEKGLRSVYEGGAVLVKKVNRVRMYHYINGKYELLKRRHQ